MVLVQVQVLVSLFGSEDIGFIMQENEEIPSVEDRIIAGLSHFRDVLKNKSSDATVLKQKDYERLVDLIENPPEPTDKLIEACQRYKKAIADGKIVVEE